MDRRITLGRGPRSDGRADAARVPDQPVPVFTAGDPPRLERACAGRAFAERRDAALIAVFKTTGIRLSELAGIRYDAGDPGRSDVDLWHREITVQGKGRKTRTVKISFDAARSLDRYLRVRARHAQAYRQIAIFNVQFNQCLRVLRDKRDRHDKHRNPVMRGPFDLGFGAGL